MLMKEIRNKETEVGVFFLLLLRIGITNGIKLSIPVKFYLGFPFKSFIEESFPLKHAFWWKMSLNHRIVYKLSWCS